MKFAIVRMAFVDKKKQVGGVRETPRPRDARVMRHLALLLCMPACSWNFIERPPTNPTKLDLIDCTASKGWVRYDALVAAVDIISGIVMLSSIEDGVDASGVKTVAGGGFALAALHLISAASGSRWVNECRAARSSHWDDDETTDEPDPAATPTPSRPALAKPKRLYCASSSPTMGSCFVREQECKDEAIRLELPACEARESAACFSVTAADGTKTNTCTVTMDECESRRRQLPPDAVVAECGMFKAK
jgi:hypothetical protein